MAEKLSALIPIIREVKSATAPRMIGSLTIVVAAFLVFASHAQADSSSQFNQYIQTTHTERAQVELKMGLDPNKDPFPQATCYYDDLVDHYEHVMLTFDEIDRGI